MERSLCSLVTLILATICAAQDGSADRTDDPIGFRKPMNGTAYHVYPSKNGKPDLSKHYVLNHRVFVQKEVCATCEQEVDVNGTKVKFIRVHIPGKPCIPEADFKNLGEDVADQRMGRGSEFQRCPECEQLAQLSGGSIDRCHYGRSYWIRSVDFEEFDMEYLAGRNVPTIGILTLPWIYRFERGDKAPLVEGGFSISAALGWKFRVSARQEMSLFPVVAPGFRSLNYTTANNSALEGDASESGSALTIAGGLIFEWEKKQVGILLGTDTPLNDLGKTYAYGGAPWLAFTIGYDLYTADSKAKGPTNE
ncbi:MAG: hypothetical protein KDC02_13995 [Flavobacteriales bacterium]|nr:hypothetical protein [Flavobacteriales bacterium]